MKFKKIFSTLLSALTVFSVSSFCSIFANEIDDAELLYTRMTEFLSKNNDVTPEKIDDVCKEFMGGKIPEENLLGEKDFEEKSIGNTILYRGVATKEYADEFKRGNIFLSCFGVRGSGIYTTTSLDCAKSFADKQNFNDTVIKAFISKDNSKILDNDYLEKLRKIIIENHSEEFGEFENKYSNEYIFDSASEYINKAVEEAQQKLDEMNLSEEDYVKEEEKVFKEVGNKLEKDPVFQKLRAEREKYYTSNKAYVWFNSGLLAKLMGFDILYTNGSLRNFFIGNEEEYLIVTPDILNVLDDSSGTFSRE